MSGSSDAIPSLTEAMVENRRLRARILELEAELAATRGTLEHPTPGEPTRITHNIPPSAPPHNE